MQAFITKGCMTDHGGIIQQGDDSWIVEGKGVHVEGMTHFCPRCKIISEAIATERGFITVNGKNFIVAGDLSTCGSRYIKISDLAVRDRGAGSSKSLNINLDRILNQEKFFDEQITTEFGFTEGMPYFIETESGKTYNGTVGTDGKLPRVKTDIEGAYQVFLGEEAIERGRNDS